MENMSYAACPCGERWEPVGRGGGQALAAALGVPLLAQIPLDGGIRTGSDEGRPPVTAERHRFAARVVQSVASALLRLAREAARAMRREGVSSPVRRDARGPPSRHHWAEPAAARIADGGAARRAAPELGGPCRTMG